jgi:hypothetical protein
MVGRGFGGILGEVSVHCVFGQNHDSSGLSRPSPLRIKYASLHRGDRVTNAAGVTSFSARNLVSRSKNSFERDGSFDRRIQ